MLAREVDGRNEMEENKKTEKPSANRPVKKIPQRKCLGCGESKNKNELIRIVRDPGGGVSLDFTGKKSGRGAYICRSAACLRKARKAKRPERSLDCEIPGEVYDALESELENDESNKK